jgi:hypothetical protein
MAIHSVKALKVIAPKAIKVAKINFSKLSGVKSPSFKGRGKKVAKF